MENADFFFPTPHRVRTAFVAPLVDYSRTPSVSSNIHNRSHNHVDNQAQARIRIAKLRNIKTKNYIVYTGVLSTRTTSKRLTDWSGKKARKGRELRRERKGKWEQVGRSENRIRKNAAKWDDEAEIEGQRGVTLLVSAQTQTQTQQREGEDGGEG